MKKKETFYSMRNAQTSHFSQCSLPHRHTTRSLLVNHDPLPTGTNQVTVPRAHLSARAVLPTDTDSSRHTVLQRHMALEVSILPCGHALQTRHRALPVHLPPHMLLRVVSAQVLAHGDVFVRVADGHFVCRRELVRVFGEGAKGGVEMGEEVVWVRVFAACCDDGHWSLFRVGMGLDCSLY